MTQPIKRGHRVQVVPGSQHVRVEVDGELIAESRRPLVLHESGLPPRMYLPPDDVRTDLLTPSATRTTCPFKGEASYWSFRGKADIAWTYADPIPAVAEIKGYLCFYDTVADVLVEEPD